MKRETPALIETIRVHRGRAPLIERHEARLRRSAAALALPGPSGSLAGTVLPRVTQPEMVVRVEVSQSGVKVDVREVPAVRALKLLIASTPHSRYPHKTTERALFEAAMAEAQAAGADDALLLTKNGLVAEGTVWSVFWWDGERLRTPSLHLGILPGIARARVMELEQVEECEVRVGDLEGVSLFLTNAVRGVVAVGTLDQRPVPSDPRTAQLSRRFWPD